MEAIKSTKLNNNASATFYKKVKEVNSAMHDVDNELNRTIGALPGGGDTNYFVVVEYLHQGNCTKTRFISTGNSKQNSIKHYHTIITYENEENQNKNNGGNGVDDRSELFARAKNYLEMPESSDIRAKKLQRMLNLLWKVRGLPFTNNIYKVEKGGGFEWWQEKFPDIPFNQVEVEAPENSKRIYNVVAEKLYEALIGEKPKH